MHEATTGSAGSPALDRRALAALATVRDFSTDALKLLLRCKELILLGTGLALGQWRDSRDPVAADFAERCQAELKTAEQREALDIIRGRILRMPSAQRKRYSPEERLRIVVFLRTYSLSLQEAGDLFMVDSATIGRWLREAIREPDAKTVGSLLKATPPVRKLDDVTQQLVAMLDSMRVGGSKRIAQMLVRAGKKISRESRSDSPTTPGCGHIKVWMVRHQPSATSGLAPPAIEVAPSPQSSCDPARPAVFPFEIAYADAEGLLPYLVPARIAA